jgi:hypothetical protein
MAAQTERTLPVPLIAAGLATVVAFLAQVFAREALPLGSPVRLGLTLLLVACFALTIWVHVRLTSSMDEFMRQVQYRALAVAFPVSLVAAFAIGYLAGEGLFAGADPRDLPLVMVVTYGASFAYAWRRYR